MKYMTDQIRKLKTTAAAAAPTMRVGEAARADAAHMDNVHVEMGEVNDFSTVLRDLQQDGDAGNAKVWGAER